MEDYLTTENQECLIERKGRVGKARDPLEYIGPKIKHDEKGVWNEHLGLLLSVIQ
jgi:hypothetical protein